MVSSPAKKELFNNTGMFGHDLKTLKANNNYGATSGPGLQDENQPSLLSEGSSNHFTTNTRPPEIGQDY